VCLLREANRGWLHVVFLGRRLLARVLRAYHQQWQPGGAQNALGNAAHHPACGSAASMGGQRDEITTVHHAEQTFPFPCFRDTDQCLGGIMGAENWTGQ
jgi:hypothetical protein